MFRNTPPHFEPDDRMSSHSAMMTSCGAMSTPTCAILARDRRNSDIHQSTRSRRHCLDLQIHLAGAEGTVGRPQPYVGRNTSILPGIRGHDRGEMALSRALAEPFRAKWRHRNPPRSSSWCGPAGKPGGNVCAPMGLADPAVHPGRCVDGDGGFAVSTRKEGNAGRPDIGVISSSDDTPGTLSARPHRRGARDGSPSTTGTHGPTAVPGRHFLLGSQGRHRTVRDRFRSLLRRAPPPRCTGIPLWR